MHGTEPLDPFAVIRSARVSTVAAIWGVIVALGTGMLLSSVATGWWRLGSSRVPGQPVVVAIRGSLIEDWLYPVVAGLCELPSIHGFLVGAVGFVLLVIYFKSEERRLELLVAISLTTLISQFLALGDGDVQDWVRFAVCAAVILGAYGALWLA